MSRLTYSIFRRISEVWSAICFRQAGRERARSVTGKNQGSARRWAVYHLCVRKTTHDLSRVPLLTASMVDYQRLATAFN